MIAVVGTPTSPSGPTQAADRIELLDAIRGVALGGILLANLMSFFGTDMLGVEARRAMAWGGAGEDVLFAINWLVEGKFYSIFSMLLGAGFALQLARAKRRGVPAEEFARFFRRRMAALIAIGLTHMYALWAGDILTLYGVMGLLLPALARRSASARVAIMAALFAVPMTTHMFVLASDGRYDPRAPFAATGLAVREQLGVADEPALDGFARGGPGDYLAWNVSFAIARPGTYLQSGRPAKVLALFLLGAWLGASVLPRLSKLRGSLFVAVVVGGIVGLSASYDYAAIKAATGSTFLLSNLGLTQTAAYTFGTTPLAIAYLAILVLAWRAAPGRAALEWFVPLGRMALSVYLTQTMIQLAIFSGYGLRLAGHVPLFSLPVLAAAILISQRYLCQWWLDGHEHGPVEWVWRRAYGARPHAAVGF